ncbi:conserved hypothetical protein [Streptococcus dysgalactiae subsp. equisimilis GGS_124]|nr:conserved hypothetical protein [Streptococcus dysgalactiae subsp. equisimilis GGS_124]
MRDCCTNHWYFDHVFLSSFNCFTDSFWNFLSFTSTKSNTTISITNNYKSCKAKTTSTFNNFCNAVNRNNAFFKFNCIIFKCHYFVSSLLEFQSVFTSCISQGFNTSVIEISTAVKHHFRNTFSHCTFSNKFADYNGLFCFCSFRNVFIKS